MAPEYRGCPPRLHLISAERGNPHEVWYDAGDHSQLRQPVGLFRKADTTPQEDKTVQEAKAGSRKAEGNHNPPDRAAMWRRSPARKGADVDRVSDPKSTVRVTNRRKSSMQAAITDLVCKRTGETDRLAVCRLACGHSAGS